MYNQIDDEQCHNCCVLDEVYMSGYRDIGVQSSNLKKITFIPYDDRRIQDVISLFKDTTTEIIIDDKKKTFKLGRYQICYTPDQNRTRSEIKLKNIL